MIDPEFKQALDQINKRLDEIMQMIRAAHPYLWPQEPWDESDGLNGRIMPYGEIVTVNPSNKP